MDDSQLEQEIKRLKNLKNSKTMTDEQFARSARVNLHVRDFKASGMFDDVEEQKLAGEKFKSYLTNHELESSSELDTLKSLVFNEVFEVRLQKELNKLFKEKKYPPDRLTKQLTDIQNQKLELKVRLGIDSEKQEENELSGLQMLMKKFDKYVNAHRNEFTLTCPHGSLMLVRKRVTDFDSMPHPWFAGRWFFNYEILKDVKDGKLSKEDAWRYLCCASQGGEYKPAFDKKYCTDYIDYCLEHWAEITESLVSRKEE
jgi:hypothetical protein